MAYDAPGRADELTDKLRDRWNEAIERAFDEQEGLRTRFFSPGSAVSGHTAVILGS